MFKLVVATAKGEIIVIVNLVCPAVPNEELVNFSPAFCRHRVIPIFCIMAKATILY